MAKIIESCAFRIKPEQTTLLHTFYSLKFPQSWSSILRDLTAKHTNRSPNQVKIPLHTLHQVFRVLIPDIINIGRNVTYSENIWLYARSNIDPATLVNIIHAWAKVTFHSVSKDILNYALTNIQTHHIQWEHSTINLAEWTTNAFNTAQAAFPHHFALLPEVIAATICQEGQIYYGDEPLNWRRASLPPGNNGAELISWPPLAHRGSFYSILFTLTVQTVPYQAYPVIYCDMGLRRWASPKARLASGERSSVYILTDTPYLPSMSNLAKQFQVATIRCIKNNDHYEFIWTNNIVEILTQLNAQKIVSDPNQLMNNPTHYLQQRDHAMAIAYNTRMPMYHTVGSGIAMPDRAQMLEQLDDSLGQYFERIPAFKRVNTKNREPKRQPSQLSAQINRLAAITNRQLAIEIYADDQEIQTTFINTIQAAFGIANLREQPTQRIEQLTLTISIHPLNSMQRPLDVANRKNLRDHVLKATEQRIMEIRQKLKPAQIPTLALIEILPKTAYRHTKGSDPKTAIRQGFAQTNRVSQFITKAIEVEIDEEPTEQEKPSNLAHRASSSLLDGIRQVGLKTGIPKFKALSEPLNLIGLWLINKNSKKLGQERYLLPVLVLLTPDNPVPLVMAPGFNDWVPYRQALIAIANDQVNAQKTWSHFQKYAEPFIQHQLKSILDPNQASLLMCQAQNIRRTWSWASNTNISRDSLFFGKQPLEQAHDWPGLRIIRVRSDQGHETPECYAYQDGGVGGSTGLFQVNERVFASFHGKPSQQRNLIYRMSKISAWGPKGKPKTKRPQPSKLAWNPACYELTVAMLQKDDTPIDWAMAVHKLRQHALDHNDATALPLPLHLAKQLEEYSQTLELDLDDDDLIYTQLDSDE